MHSPKHTNKPMHRRTEKEQRVRRGVSFEPDVFAALLKTANSQSKGDVSETLNHILRKALKISEGNPAETRALFWRLNIFLNEQIVSTHLEAYID